MRLGASALAMPVFFRLWVSLAEAPRQNISTPHASPRSRPFSLSTSPESIAPAGLAGGQPPEQLVGVGHLRDLLRVDERAHLDDVHAGLHHAADPGFLLLDRDDLLLHLQPVARPDLVDDDARHVRPRYSLAATASPISRVLAEPPMS